jgi:hypothetical protein
MAVPALNKIQRDIIYHMNRKIRRERKRGNEGRYSEYQKKKEEGKREKK